MTNTNLEKQLRVATSSIPANITRASPKRSSSSHHVRKSPENVAPTLGFSSFHLRHQNFHVTIYDLGGSKSIRGIWRNYLAEAYGFIFVIDASDSNRVQECRDVLYSLLKNPIVSGKPFLILANKQDVDGALDEVEICGLLDIETLVNEAKSRTRVETCSALKSNSRKPDKPIQAGFRWLLTTIGIDFNNLKQKVEQDVAIQRKLEEKEKQEREERVKKLREERENSGSPTEELRDASDTQTVDENPFKPITILVKGLKENDSAITEDQEAAAPQHSESTHRQEIRYPQQQMTVLSNDQSDNRNKGNDAERETHLVKQVNSVNDLTHNSSNNVHEKQSSSQFNPSVKEANVARDDVEVICEDLCVSENSPTKKSKNVTKTGVPGINKLKPIQKMALTRHNKTAPMPNDHPQSGALPPLLLKAGHGIPWGKLTLATLPVLKTNDCDHSRRTSKSHQNIFKVKAWGSLDLRAFIFRIFDRPKPFDIPFKDLQVLVQKFTKIRLRASQERITFVMCCASC